ncbi:hypothetical protein TRIUR3_35060 [Triticum urartu]|uniref:Uncharacterized protein n=1 Tax=Triticum urartu TaxID=4572 RepID=M7ZCA0_TRIUA|nr:hypothetical protein TRIUR3_35060 [Triticum urartu]
MPDAGSSSAPDAEALRSEISELRLKLARLESILEENTKTSRSKAYTLEEGNKPTEAMETDNQLLRNEESYSESNIYIMEDEAQILQQEVRKINNIAYTIESLAIDAEKRVEFLSSEVKKIESIITEQWIQIRQFEQAFVVTKMMTSKVHKRRFSEGAYKWSGKDILLKYVRNVDLHGMFLAGASKFHKAIQYQCSPDVDVPNAFFLGGSISRSCISLPYKQFKISISSAQQIHYKVPFFLLFKSNHFVEGLKRLKIKLVALLLLISSGGMVQLYLQDAMRSNIYSRGIASEPVTFCLKNYCEDHVVLRRCLANWDYMKHWLWQHASEQLLRSLGIVEEKQWREWQNRSHMLIARLQQKRWLFAEVYNLSIKWVAPG